MKSYKKFNINLNIFMSSKLRGILYVFLLALLFSPLAGCKSVGDSDGEEEERASLFLNISLPQSRSDIALRKPLGGASDVVRVTAQIKEGDTLLLNIDESDWTLDSGSRSKNVIGLPAGSLLSFNVQALNSDDVAIFEGSINKVLVEGSNDVIITMNPVDDGISFQHVSVADIDYPTTILTGTSRAFTFYFQGNAHEIFDYYINMDDSSDGFFDHSSGDASLDVMGEYTITVNYTAPEASGDYWFQVTSTKENGESSFQKFIIQARNTDDGGDGTGSGGLQISFPPVVKTTGIGFNQYEHKLFLNAQTDPISGVNYSWQVSQGERTLVMDNSNLNQAAFNGYNAEATAEISLTVSDDENNNLRSSVYFSLKPKTFALVENSSWQIVGDGVISDDSSDGAINLAVYNHGNGAATPYVAYTHSGWTQTGTYSWQGFYSDETKVMHFNNDSWETVGSLAYIPNLPDATSDMSMDSLSLTTHNGVAYLAYKDTRPELDGSRATVIKFNEGSGYWEAVGSSRVSDCSADALSLAISDNGTIFLAYVDEDNGGKPMVKKFNGVAWQTVGVGPVSDQSADMLKLALDGETPYLGYSYPQKSFRDLYIQTGEHYERILETYEAEIKKFNGASWETLGVSLLDMDGSGDERESIIFDHSNDSFNLDIDDNGVPHFAYNGGFPSGEYFGCWTSDGYWSYYCETLAYKAKVKKFDDADWVSVGDLDENPDTTTDSIRVRSLTVSDNGVPYLAYTENANLSRGGVKKFNGYFWENVGEKGLSDASADSLKIDVYSYVDAFGNTVETPYISYQDSTGDIGVTLKKFVE